MASVLAIDLGSVVKRPLIGLPEEGVEGLQLFCATIQSCDSGGNHQLEALEPVYLESSLLEVERCEPEGVDHSFNLGTGFKHSDWQRNPRNRLS